MNENEELFANLRSGYFQVQERSIDGLKYIQPNAGADKYIISHYRKDQYYGFILQKQPYMQEVHLVLLSSKSEVRDVISDDILISKLQENIDITLLHDNPEEFQRLYSNSPFLIDNPNDIREKRVQKIQSIINNALTYENEKKSAITSLIYKCNGEDIQKLLGDKIKESEEYKKVVENNDAFNRQTDEARAEVKQLEAKLEELKNQTHLQNNTANSVDDNELKDRRKEKNELDVKIEILKSEVLELEKQLYDLSVIKNLKDERMYLERRTDELGKEVDKLESKQKKLQSDVKEAITKGVNESAQNAFDPYISNALVEAAGQWRSQSELQDYEEIANFMEKYECDIIEKKDFLDIQVSGIQKFRSYTKNDILNMYICLSQNFLTIFSGEPGTGKTSICDILANSLGLNIFDNKKDERGKTISKNRYIPISVERGWSSKRDLIGYFNPLTKKYDRSNAKIYDGLMILNQEREKSRFPYIVLLDEANLSQVEYYWADFMRAADKTFNKYDETVMINIGLDEEIYIPKTLRFLATINNDHTTEELSPRLIDRAWIIKLPEVDPKEITDKISDCFKSPVIWDTIENTFIRSENMIVILKKPLNDIYALFDKFHLSVSPRVKQSIERYICVAQEIMEDELGVTKKEKALDYAVIQKLLPKINGLYSNYENLFKRLLEICTENHLKMTTEALTVMQEYSNQNMGYCKYLM